MAYQLMALLADDTTLTLDALAVRLRQRFAGDSDVKVRFDPNNRNVLRVEWPDWSYRLGYEAEPHVLLESQEIADEYAANHPDWALIAACGRRLVVSGDDDPNMDHFNDYVFIMEVLESFAGVYLFDPQEGDFIGS